MADVLWRTSDKGAQFTVEPDARPAPARTTVPLTCASELSAVTDDIRNILFRPKNTLVVPAESWDP